MNIIWNCINNESYIENTEKITKWIETKLIDSNRNKLKLTDNQIDILFNVEANTENIFIKGRQIGMSTIMLAHSTYVALDIPHSIIFMVVYSSDVKRWLFDSFKYMLFNSFGQKNNITLMSNGEVKFFNDSMIKIITPYEANQIKNYDIDHLILDECAFYDFNKIISYLRPVTRKLTLYSSVDNSPRFDKNMKQFKKLYDSSEYSETYYENKSKKI